MLLCFVLKYLPLLIVLPTENKIFIILLLIIIIITIIKQKLVWSTKFL